MSIEYKSLPVYAQKQKILNCIQNNQVVIVESPTGSGKTTQIPVILYEAGYANAGLIGVTQPRRIAALSVSEFISKQLGTNYPGLVGYKMRFEDVTNQDTRIKIMTDGILLQEMKLDPSLSKYSVLMIDEAHERSLNIDFVLGLLKRVLQQRRDFRVIISSATMNTKIFSEYFNNAPIVSIDTVTFPVKIFYQAIPDGTTTITDKGTDLILRKITQIVSNVLDQDDEGSILVFLPGEKIIKDCLSFLRRSPVGRQLHIVPLYGRLAKEEQEKVFDPAPHGKRKIVLSTNIAETSITISDVTTVIDSGLCKLNFYSPHTFTSSLLEQDISKASCDQRKGRAGRTRSGTCYRLYSEENYNKRILYTTEEIFRTDLSEVVLRMAELGIQDFYNFDFISKPERQGITGAIETLNMLGALDKNHNLTSIGEMMTIFPLEPRISRMIVEAILYYPTALSNVLIAASFLSTNSPFVLPPNEEMQARRAHHQFTDIQGDFCSYLNLFNSFNSSKNQEKFCKNNYLDLRIMSEIKSIYEQLSEIISTKLQFPISSQKANINDFLCCIAVGMIQFICVRISKNNYKTLTEEHICIHPGSVMFKQEPLFFVAGEIVKTSRTYAMSVSPLTKKLLDKINPSLINKLLGVKQIDSPTISKPQINFVKPQINITKPQNDILKPHNNVSRPITSLSQLNIQNNIFKEIKVLNTEQLIQEEKRIVTIGKYEFEYEPYKSTRLIHFPIAELLKATYQKNSEELFAPYKDFLGTIYLKDEGTLLALEKIETILKAVKFLTLTPIEETKWDKELTANVNIPEEKEKLLHSLYNILRTTLSKPASKIYGFITLLNNQKGVYWYKVLKTLDTAIAETHSSLETLIEENVDFTKDEISQINISIRLVNNLYN